MRIYFIEQEEVIRNTVRDFLGDLGHEVVARLSIDDLVDALSQDIGAADLLLVSASVGDGRALRLLGDLHGSYPDIPVIVVTESRASLPVDEAMACGVFGYLRKPIHLSELELMLIRLAGRRQAVPQLF